jgi:predicted helicase
MGSINDVMEAFRRAPTNYDRGALFERLMLRYFQLDPALSQQYDLGAWRLRRTTGRRQQPTVRRLWRRHCCISGAW